MKEIYEKDKKFAGYACYRPKEFNIKADTNKPLKFLLTSIAPPQEMNFSYGADLIWSRLLKHEDIFTDRACIIPNRYSKLMPNKIFNSMYFDIPANEFDVIGVSINMTFSFFNIPEILKQCGQTLLQTERSEKDPIIIGGGQVFCNPEPIYGFFDAMLIGEGDEAIIEICESLIKNKNKSRIDRIEALSEIEGVYVPHLKTEKTIIKKRIVKDFSDYILGGDDFVSKPNNKVIEIGRGCPYKCSFCQLSHIMDPYREAEPDKLCKKIATYKENSIIYPFAPDESSFSNYDRIYKELERNKLRLFRFNSRINSFSDNIQERKYVSEHTISFGVDGLSDRIRKAIGKGYTVKQLYNSVEHAIKQYSRIKLNIVFGFPSETDNDFKEFDEFIGWVCSEVLKRKDQPLIQVAPTPFVAMAHTPMQWFGMPYDNFIQIKIEDIRKKNTKASGYKKLCFFGINSLEYIKLDYLFQRAGREFFKVLLDYGRAGKFLSGNISKIYNDIEKIAYRHNIKINDYLREYDIKEPLPHDFIKFNIPKEKLIKRYLKIKEMLFNGS